MSAREIISLLFRERIAVVIAFLVPLILALTAYKLATPRYEATAKLLLGAAQFEDTANVSGQANATPYSTKQELLNSELEILNSRDLARATIDDIGLGNLYPALANNAASADTRMTQAVDQFQSTLAVRPVKASNIIEVAFASTDPAQAVTVLRQLIDRYQQKHIEVHSHPISGFLDTQVAGFQHNLRNVEGEIAELKSAKRIVSIDDERKQLLDNRNAMFQTITQLRARSAELDSRIAQLRELLQKTPENIDMYTETEQSDSLERTKSQLLDLQLQEKQLTSRYGDENRQVQSLRSQIGLLQAYIDKAAGQFSGRVRKGRNPLYDEMVAEIARAQAEIKPSLVRADALSQDITRIDDRLKILDGAQRILVGLDRERESLELNVKTYAQRQADAHIMEELDRQKIVSISIIQDPQAGAGPAQPRLFRYVGLGIGGGLALTVALIGLIFAFRNTYIAPEGVESATNVPVLVSLPAR
jgi:uncharacterized protein involved in exopolysaccharide biosynthesis